METNEELRAKYNPEGSDLRRAQLRMLDMLLYLDKVCKENEITYWLAAGTCLGAVPFVKRIILNILYQEDHYWGPLGIKVLFLGMMILISL